MLFISPFLEDAGAHSDNYDEPAGVSPRTAAVIGLESNSLVEGAIASGLAEHSRSMTASAAQLVSVAAEEQGSAILPAEASLWTEGKQLSVDQQNNHT